MTSFPLVGATALLVVDIQEMAFASDGEIPCMAGYGDRMRRAVPVVAAARQARIPVIFAQEVHHPTHVDFGRELDGAEGVHCLEDDPRTALHHELRPEPDEYHVAKRRYSCFFGTDLAILLNGLKTETLVLCGGLTDVCIHYTFADAHQHDFHVRVVEDAVAGSTEAAHDASLRAMAYLQRDALVGAEAIISAFGSYDGPRRPPVGG